MSDGPLARVGLAIGSNLGESLVSLRAAVKALETYVEISAISQVYETAPVYVTDQPVYLNAAIAGITKINPLALLWLVKDIESELGRLPTYRYGPRVIDIDIAFYGDSIIETPELIIPHRHMAEREFVLRPLSEVAPDWRHPQTGLTASEMCALLPDSGMINLGKIL